MAEETAALPTGWKERLIVIHNDNTGGSTGLCLEVHDLAVSKLVAGREKDLSFVSGLLCHHLAQPETIAERLKSTPILPERRATFEARLRRLLD